MSNTAVIESGADLQEALARLLGLVNSSNIESARTYVKELVREWPDSERVQHWARVLEPPRLLARQAASGGSFTLAEKAWLKAYAGEYPGCWIALDDERMIAADPDLDVVRAAAKAAGAIDPLFHYTPDYHP